MRIGTPAGGGLCLLIALLLTTVAAAPAFGHGSMSDPVSRSLQCFRENPETPDSDACRAALAVGGTQPFYDWMEVNIMNAAGRHRELIPDGRLCGAGRDKYSGLDLARADWPATPLDSGAPYTFRYSAPSPHGGRWDLYVTRDGYDPTQPLRWADLEPAPFLTAADPPLVGGDYLMEGTLPAGKTGRQLIYSIWQRHIGTDSPEAFYTCSDVDFGGSSGGPVVGSIDPGGSDDLVPTPPSQGGASEPDVGGQPAGNGRAKLRARFRSVSGWDSGYVGQVVVRNAGRSPVEDWRVRFELPRSTAIGGSWDAGLARKGRRVVATPMDWNRRIEAGQKVRFGFEAAGTARPRTLRVLAGR